MVEIEGMETVEKTVNATLGNIWHFFNVFRISHSANMATLHSLDYLYPLGHIEACQSIVSIFVPKREMDSHTTVQVLSNRYQLPDLYVFLSKPYREIVDS